MFMFSVCFSIHVETKPHTTLCNVNMYCVFPCQDTNDNTPQFSANSYTLYVDQFTTPGAVIGKYL